MSRFFEKLGALSVSSISNYALIGGPDRVTGFDDSTQKVILLFREEVLSVDAKYVKRLGQRAYLSQVYLEARKGRDPSHLFKKRNGISNTGDES